MIMSRRITLRTISSPDKLRASDQSSHQRMKQQTDKIFRVVKAIAEWSPMELFHIAIFILYKFFNIYDKILLLG